MRFLLEHLLEKIIRRGRLEVTWANGDITRYGSAPGPNAHVRFCTARAERAMLINPELRLGQLYVSGEVSFQDPNGPLEFLLLIDGNWQYMRNTVWTAPLAWLRFSTRHLRQRNNAESARRNAAHHYDIDARLYRLFLDEDLQYSCAYFERSEAPIDDAQAAKKRHIASKLLLDRGQTVLDIGCGYGGLGLYLARLSEMKVTGVTLSGEQQKIAEARAIAEGLASRVHFSVEDYRSLRGPYDRIVSIGMFEHVGEPHYGEFFQHAARLLAPNGIMLLHSIGRFGPPAASNPWIERYIFPGGYAPSLSEVLLRVERSGLVVTDIEILRLHYAETLKTWRERFRARWDEAAKIYDECFCRMWDFYLAGFESAFRGGTLMVFQLQLTKTQTALPLTRDYMFEAERRLREDAEFSGIEKRAVPLRSAR